MWAKRIIREAGIRSLYRISSDSLFGQPVEELFTSQVLGKAAGLISSGHRPEEFGPEMVGPVTLDIPEASVDNGMLTGAVVSIDNFGNCVTNIPEEMLDNLDMKIGDSVVITTVEGNIPAGFGSRYKDVPFGREVVFINRLNLLELAINMGNFAGTYNIETGMKVEIVINK